MLLRWTLLFRHGVSSSMKLSGSFDERTSSIREVQYGCGLVDTCEAGIGFLNSLPRHCNRIMRLGSPTGHHLLILNRLMIQSLLPCLQWHLSHRSFPCCQNWILSFHRSVVSQG